MDERKNIAMVDLLEEYESARAALEDVRSRAAMIRNEETDASNRFNQACKSIEDAMKHLRASAPKGTDWASSREVYAL